MTVLAFDTATAATVVGLQLSGGEALEARHDPAPGERPGHAECVLVLVAEVLERAQVGLAEVTRFGVGVGPGSFTGLRIGVATGRGLAQATGAELVGVSSLAALAAGAPAAAGRPVLAVLDARRGEVFAAAWEDGEPRLAARPWGPSELAVEVVATMDPRPLAVGDGALRFRAELESAGAVIPPDDQPAHRVGAGSLCRLALAAEAGDPGAVLPQYGRLPDAEIAQRQRTAR